jgi:UDP-glucose 4-epimerase
MAQNIAKSGASAVFNIGSGVGRSLNEIVEIVRGLVKRKVHVDYLEGRSFDVPVNVLDISLAKAALNWEPRLSLEIGLARMHDDVTAGSLFYSSLN